MSGDDVDASDNTDDFSVIVAGKGGSGGRRTRGGLPVTGAAGRPDRRRSAPRCSLAGGVMFLVARRRRVVLVDPGRREVDGLTASSIDPRGPFT